ncbi:MAG: GIY-YIG nuclease family protein [Candidatus Paceibacterota bacterium]|jgi:excinuclease UvrABC nuclease subunit
MTKTLAAQIKKLPQTPGVYFFKDRAQNVIYIGKAKNVRKRVESHFARGGSSFNFYAQVRSVDCVQTRGEKEALILESALVKKLQPKYNIELKDDKNFFFVAISHDTVPRVYLTHQPNQKRRLTQEEPQINADNQRLSASNPRPSASFIGPFVSGKELKYFMADIRKIFPYKTCKNKPENPCLYYHLGLCAGHREKLSAYPLVIAGLETLLRIYNGNPNKIECYDISNTSGSLSVGSLAALVNNRPAKKWYRKFKIKTVRGSNDPASLKEVLGRRINHPEWPYPDMVIVDGGKGQLSRLKNFPLPLIGITKREDAKRTKTLGSLVSPYGAGTVLMSALPTPVRDTILRARDEAHRFAIAYHRHRRIKAIS